MILLSSIIKKFESRFCINTKIVFYQVIKKHYGICKDAEQNIIVHTCWFYVLTIGVVIRSIFHILAVIEIVRIAKIMKVQMD